MPDEMVIIIHLIFGLIKNILLYKRSHFAEPPHSRNEIKVELCLSNYATKPELKNATVDTSKFAENADLASVKLGVDKSHIDELEKPPCGLNSLKSKVDKLDVDKLKPVSVDLKKLSDVVDNDVIKKTT